MRSMGLRSMVVVAFFMVFMCVLVCGYSVTAARACENIYAVMIVLLSGNSFTG